MTLSLRSDIREPVIFRAPFLGSAVALIVGVLIQATGHALAQSPADLPLTETIDLSPGPDVYAPSRFALNEVTHKLYVAGRSGPDYALKVIDAQSLQVLGAIKLGRYMGSNQGFDPSDIAIDESAAAEGNKIYVVGRSSTANLFLRIIDGGTDQPLTDENSDIFLPVSFGEEEFASMAINAANHKLYIAKTNGEIVVVDGLGRAVLKTLAPNAGNFVVADPVHNKVFVCGHNGGAVIDSATDEVTPALLTFFPAAAAFDPSTGRIYFVGTSQNGNNGIFVVDGNTGALLASKTGLPEALHSVAIAPDEDALYAAGANNVLSFDLTDLESKSTFPHQATQVARDAARPGTVFYLSLQFAELGNAVGVLKTTDGSVDQLTIGYRAYEVAINNRTNRIYVTDEQAAEVLVLDGTSHAIAARIPASSIRSSSDSRAKQPSCVSQRLNRFYLSGYRQIPKNSRAPTIEVYEGATNNLRSTLPLPASHTVTDLAFDDVRRRLYVGVSRPQSSSTTVATLLVYDAESETLVTSIDFDQGLGAYVRALSVNQFTGRLYVSTGSIASGRVIVLDANTNSIITEVELGSATFSGELVVNTTIDKIYSIAGNGTGAEVTVIDGFTNTVEGTFSNENEAPTGAAVDELSNTIYLISGCCDGPGFLRAYNGNNGYQLSGRLALPAHPTRVAFNRATRQVLVSNDEEGTIAVVQAPGSPAQDRVANISTRLRVLTGDDVLIGGFVMEGTQPKKVMIRALGPSLPVPGILENPTIELHDSAGKVIASNDDWYTSEIAQQIIDSNLAPKDGRESAILLALEPGLYTAVVRGVGGTTGVALVEVYDLDASTDTHLVNVSTRGFVETGDRVMIGGVVVLGEAAKKVLVRGIGPSLKQFGVPNLLADPVLTMYDVQGNAVAVNNDWKESQEAEISATKFGPENDRESAIVLQLEPGSYTAIVRGVNDSTGNGLVEVYTIH